MLKRNTAQLSLSASKTVRGYEITRAPLGRFLEALELLSDFPEELAQSLLDGGDMRALLKALKNCDEKLLWRLVGRALRVAPTQLIELLATLSQIDAERLRNDPAIGLDGLVEIVAAWLELNDFSGFFHNVSELAAEWRSLTKTGSNGSLRAR